MALQCTGAIFVIGGEGKKVDGLLFGVYGACGKCRIGRGGWDRFPEMIKKEERRGYSKPYSTAMRHASLAFLLGEACCRRLCEEAKSSSQAGQECALSVDRGDLRGV